MPAKAQGVGQHQVCLHRQGLVGHIVQVTGGVGLLQVDGGGQDALLQGLRQATASMAPAAPRQWPVMDLVELM